MKYLIITLSALLMLLVTAAVLSAQPGLPQPPSQAPIDGGLGVLAAAGGAYAWKKLRKSEPKA
jgi:hypothetical protein